MEVYILNVSPFGDCKVTDTYSASFITLIGDTDITTEIQILLCNKFFVLEMLINLILRIFYLFYSRTIFGQLALFLQS